MNEKKEWVDTKKLWQISGDKTLRKHEYHTRIGSHVNINMVFLCAMCRNIKETLQK